MSQRKHINEISVSGPITLADLRWLVAQCEGMGDGSQVSVQARREYNQLDCDPEQITVHGTAARSGGAR